MCLCPTTFPSPLPLIATALFPISFPFLPFYRLFFLSISVSFFLQAPSLPPSHFPLLIFLFPLSRVSTFLSLHRPFKNSQNFFSKSRFGKKPKRDDGQNPLRISYLNFYPPFYHNRKSCPFSCSLCPFGLSALAVMGGVRAAGGGRCQVQSN